MAKITCPKCEIEGSFSLSDPSYEGPYRCWKCHELFMIMLEGDVLKSCEPITQEEFDRQQQVQAMRNKFRK